MKRITSTLLYVISIFTLLSCTDEPQGGDHVAEEVSSSQRDIYEAFESKFEEGVRLRRVFDTSDLFVVTMEDDWSIDVRKEDVRLIRCGLREWPAVTLRNDVWSVNGKSTGIAYADTESKQCIVAAVYDTHGLYLRLADGSIIYFHPEEVYDIGCFRFEAALNPALSEDVVCRVSDGVISAVLPAGTNSSSLIATFGCRGDLFHDTERLHSGQTKVNYNGNLKFRQRADDATKFLDVRVAPPQRIPVLRINTAGNVDVNTKEYYFDATLKIEDPDLMYSTEALTEMATQIRGRGNSTWDMMPKKPYRLKLGQKSRLLGMSNDKDWALIANYSDKTLIRNNVAYEMSRILGMSWTPDNRPVELYLNNDYKGQYMLTEHVKVSDERVNIVLATEGDTSPETITGGYFLEIDMRMGEDVNFETSKGLPINFKGPKAPTAGQLEYVKDYFWRTENALYGNDFRDPVKGYAAYIDVVSFAHNYILQELTKNVDGNMRLSSFLVKPRGEKLAHSHVWDFDLTIGNCYYIDKSPTGYYIKYAPWYERLLRDPAFVAVVEQEWNKLYSQMSQVYSLIDELTAQIDAAQKRNFNRWKILGTYVWPNAVVKQTYKEEVEYMTQFLTQRAEWLNNEIKQGNLLIQ